MGRNILGCSGAGFRRPQQQGSKCPAGIAPAQLEILCFAFTLTLLFLQSVPAEAGRQSRGSSGNPGCPCGCLTSTSSLSQNGTQELSPGPEPPFFNMTNLTLLPSLSAENAPAGKTFGDVLEEVRPDYREVRASGKP